MALYRTVAIAFWTDSKVVDDFTPEDKYFYLYLFTNPHTNLCGCYELSFTQAANELGYNKETIDRLVRRFIQVHKVIDYCYDNKEVLLINWGKHNWTSSAKYRVPLWKQIEEVKNPHFKAYLEDLFKAEDTVSIRYQYRSDTTSTIAITNTSTFANAISDSNSLNTTSNLNPIGNIEPISNNYSRQDSIKNIKEKPKKKKKEPVRREVYFPLDEKLNETYKAFVEMKEELGKPFLTDHAIELSIKRLMKYADNDNDKAILILENSIRQNWLDVYELKDEKPTQKTQQKDKSISIFMDA